MKTKQLPKVCKWILDALSIQLGRKACVRWVSNISETNSECYIYDPVWSFAQRGTPGGSRSGYRIGLYLNMQTDVLEFRLLHAPKLAKLFKNHILFDEITNAIILTARYRDSHSILFSSRSTWKKCKNQFYSIHESSLKDFLCDLKEFNEKHDFAKDLFPKIPCSGKGILKDVIAGHTFYLALASPLRRIKKFSDAKFIIKTIWPLLSNLYPEEPIKQRIASLRRNLSNAKITKQCEFSTIVFKTKNRISPACKGAIQAAHIRPWAKGGSDAVKNGIWLCEHHHRITEGRIKGVRGKVIFK